MKREERERERERKRETAIDRGIKTLRQRD